MTDNLKTIYEGLAGKNPALKEYGYDAFAKDMQVPENLEKVYKGLATKNKQIAEYGFENFQKDMFGEPQQESVKKSLSTEQESLKQAFRENPRSAMGMPIDTAKQIVGDVVDEQFTDERGFKGFGKELVNRGARGAEELNQMLINAPNTFMRVINAPFNTLYRAVGLPEVDPQTFNKITGLDKVSDDIDKKKEFYTQRIKELNPDAEKSVTQAAKEGDWVTFTRNLAGGVADSFAPSMAMMLSGGTMGAPAMIGSGALLFGSGKLKEIDEASPDMPENLKLLVAGANGALEGIFETYLGSGAVGGAIRELALREGRDAARRTVMEGLRQGFSKVLADRPMLAPLGEGFEEMGTQIAQNYVDKVSGYRPDIDVTDGVLDAGLIGVASGLSHTPFIGVPKIMNKWSRNQQLTDDTQQTPNIDPVEAVRTDIRSTVQTRSHDSGNIVMSYLEGVGPVFIRSGQYENGKFNDPDGMIIYYDRNGNPGAAGQEFFSGDVQEFTPEQFEEMEVGRFQTELERRKIAQEQAVEIGGQYFVPTGQMDDEGNHIIVPLDQNMNPVEAQATTMAPEQFEKVFQAKQVQKQAVEEGKPKPEVKKTTWGKNEYQYTLNEDGTADVLIPNSINPESAFKEIQNAFKDNARFEAVPITEIREIPAKDDFSDPTTESILTGIKIVPKQIATPVPSQDNKKTEKQAEPKYTFNKENLSREEVSEMINLAEDPNELNGLRIDNDPELQQMLLSKFPDKTPRLSIAGQEATEAQVKARIRLGKNLDQIQIENSPELQILLDKKVKELTKSEKNVSNSLQNVPEKTTGTPVNAANVTPTQGEMLPKSETATEGQSTNLETQRAEIEKRRQEDKKRSTAGLSRLHVMAADYLLTGGAGSMLSTDYLLQGIGGVFSRASAEIDSIREKYTQQINDTNLADIKNFMTSDLYKQMMSEIRNVVASAYSNNAEVLNMLDEVFANPTGMPYRSGNQISIRIDEIHSQIESEINAKYDAELAALEQQAQATEEQRLQQNIADTKKRFNERKNALRDELNNSLASERKWNGKQLIKTFASELLNDPNVSVEDKELVTKSAQTISEIQSAHNKQIKALKGQELTEKKPRPLSELQQRAVDVDVYDPESIVKQYFIQGGKINKKALEYIYGNKSGTKRGTNPAVESERRRRIGYYAGEGKGKGVDEIAHELWEMYGDITPNATSVDYRDAVVNVIHGFNSTTKMAESIVNAMGEQVQSEQIEEAELEEEAGEIVNNNPSNEDTDNAIETFVKSIGQQNNWFTTESLLNIIEQNKDKLQENDYITFKNYLDELIQQGRQDPFAEPAGTDIYKSGYDISREIQAGADGFDKKGNKSEEEFGERHTEIRSGSIGVQRHSTLFRGGSSQDVERKSIKEGEQSRSESTEWNIGDILTHANGEKFTITQIGKTANGDKHLYTAESEGGGLIRVTSDNSNIVEVEKKESNSTKYIIPIETAIENAPKKAEIKKEEKKVEPNPSEAQKEAGNYQKGHIKVQGFDISIENSKGSKRSGTDKSGKKWEQTMNNTYGYFKRTKGKDGDQIDTFIGNNPETGKIFVVDQFIDGKFDEHKVMLGFNSEEEAREAYLSNYEEGWHGLGNITEVSHQDFKEWLKDGTRTDKPFAETRVVIKADNPQDATPLEKKLEEIAEEKKPKETPLEKGLRQFNESPDKERSLKILKENIAELKKSIDVLGSTKDKQNKLNESEQLLDAINKSNKKQEKEEAGRTVMYRRVSDIGFYSTVEDALEKISQEKGTPEQFKAMLLKNGAKQAEMDWMGFDEFAEGKKSVTKTEIQDWINQNRIEVEEEEKSEKPEIKWTEKDGNTIGSASKAGMNFLYSIRKRDNYFAIYNDLTSKQLSAVNTFEEAKNYIENKIYKGYYLQGDTKYSQYQLIGGKNYKEVLLTMPVKDKELKKLENKYGEKWLTEATSDEIQKVQKENKGQGTFKSSHFDEPNILAHIRFNERTDSEGNKVLFIEEIQSDWAQEGRKEGFKGEPNPVYDINGELIVSDTQNWEGKVPDMPFKQTPQWVNLALRRMMRYAAENGFDRIAWTSGEIQAERYDLSKQVDSIETKKEKNGLYTVLGNKNGKDVFTRSDIEEKELEGIIGKDLSKKVIDYHNDVSGDWKSFSGIDLQVGGEGMKAFYDAIIPSAASKLGKPFGAKIESIQIDVNPKITDKEKSASNDKYATIQSIPITESMRESVKRGVPLFRQYDIDSAVSDANDKISSAKTLDEKHSVILETVEAIESVFGEISNVITSKNEKEFFELLETEGLSESKINEIKKDFEDSRKGKTIIPGLMIDGNIYLISDNIANYNDLIETWLHEKSHTIIRKEFTRDELIELAKELGDQEMNKVLPKEDHKLAPQHKADETISYTISNFLKGNNLQDVLTGNVDIDNLHLSLQYAVNRVLTRFNEYGKSNNQIKDRGQRNTLSRTDGKTSLRGIPENQIRESGNRRQGSIEAGQRTPLERRLAEIAANSAAKNNRKALKHSPTFIDERLESGSYMPEKIVVDGVERHTRNSNGQLIQPTRRGIENFWKWFGDSKVVDEQGRPLVVYHGTNAEFNEFKLSEDEIGIHFGDIKHAEFRIKDKKNASIIPVYIKIDNPIKLKDRGGFYPEVVMFGLNYWRNLIPETSYSEFDKVESYINSNKNKSTSKIGIVVELLKNNGYDGIEYKNLFEDENIIEIKEKLKSASKEEYERLINNINEISKNSFAVFSPTQIKSATENNGNFDPNNPDIRYRRTSPVTPLERAAERSVYNKTDKRSMGEVIDGMKEYYYEKDLPINTWQKNILTNGGKIDQKYDPYKTKKRAPGRLEYLVDTYMKDYFEPIEKVVAEIVKKTGVERSYIVPYLISKHAPERNATIRNQKIDEYAKAEQWKLELWIKNTDPEQSEIDKRQKNLDERIEKYREELSGIDFSGILPFTENQDGSNDYEGRPDELAQEIVNDFEGKIGKDLSDKLWEAVNKATGAVLEAQVASNWMTDKEADGYRDRWKYYIPLRGWLEDAAKTFNYINNGKGGRTMQHAGGRQSVAENPLGYLVHIAHKAYQEQVDMEVKNALLKTVVLNRNNDFKNLHNVKRAYFYKDGTDPVTGETLWRISTEKPTDDQIDNGEAVIESFGEHMKLRKKEHGLQHEVFVRSEHGNFIVVFPNNPDVAQAFNNENYMYRTLLGGKKADSRSENSFVETKIDLGPLGSWSLRNFTNFIKGMFTQYNIQFVVNNFPRDLFESNIDSYILDNNPFGVAYNTKRGIQSIDRYLRGKKTNDEALIKQFYSLGGATGHTHNLTPEEYVEKVNKEIDMLIKGGNLHRGKVEIAKWLTRWNQRFEDGVRYSVFLNQLALGKSPEEAAFRARNATVDFNIRGKGSPWLGTLWAFFEVSANSLAKGTSYFTKTPYTNIAKPGNRRRAAAVAGTFLAIGFIEAMINDIADDDDDEKDYYNRSAWMRHNYLNFPIGGNKYITLALPQFWRGFKAMGAVLYDYSIGQRGKLTAGKAIAQIASNFMAGLSPVDIGSAFAGDEFRPLSPFVPAFLRPIYELSINRDFTDRKIAIEPFTEQQKRDLAKSGLHGKNVNTAIKFFTDTWFKFGGGDNETKVYTDPKTGEQKRVSWFMDINPAQVEHLIKGYMGGTYTFLSNMVNTGYQMASSEEDVDFRNVPFVTAFIRKTPESKWKTIEEWYNNKDGANDFKVALKAYKKQAYSGDKEAEEKYRITMQNNYNQEYNKLIEGYSGIINELAKNADYQKENGMDDVVNLMKEANKAIEDLKDKYSK